MTVAQDEILGTANRLHPRSPVGTTDTSTVRGPSARASNVGPDDTPGVPSPEQSRGVSPRNDANPLQFALCEQSRGVSPRNDANGRNSPLCKQSRGVSPRTDANPLEFAFMQAEPGRAAPEYRQQPLTRAVVRLEAGGVQAAVAQPNFRKAPTSPRLDQRSRTY